jgi:glutamine synthetase
MSVKKRIIFADHLNIARGKYVKADANVANFCSLIFRSTYADSMIADDDLAKMYDLQAVVDDKSTHGSSWEDNTTLNIADLYVDDKPFYLCARGQLKKTLAKFHELGFYPYVGFEVEGYLFEKDGAGEWQPNNNRGAKIYGTGRIADPTNLLTDIWNRASECFIPMESMSTEFDPAQYEFALEHQQALTAVDNLFLFKQMSRELAAEKGYRLTYMPNPIPDRSVAALHYNISLKNKDGVNLMPEIASQCIAGLLHHHKALSAIVASTINSYEQIAPGKMSGYWANWAEDTRLTTIRSFPKHGDKSRIEYRLTDFGANPYFCLNAMLQAILLSITNNYPLIPSVSNNKMIEEKSDNHMPLSLSDALVELKNDTPLVEALGTRVVDHYIKIKELEITNISGTTFKQQFDYYSPFL